MKTTIIAAAFSLMSVVTSQAADKTLKVFILAGQSNMEGHAGTNTFDYIGDDPATAPLLKQMRNPDGTPKVCDHVWVSYLTGSPDHSSDGEVLGKMTAGFGSGAQPDKLGFKIGPEFTFGLRMDEKLDQPVLLIKVAWGGKSLSTDFRPPSADPHERKEKQEASGLCYRLMIEHVRKVLKDIKRVYPDYKEGQGYELAGFVWLQGWNDYCDDNTYRDGFGKYSEWLADFIRDVRKDLSAPKMKFVIGVMGVFGNLESLNGNQSKGVRSFRQAMAAPVSLPEFQGNVIAVETAPFWDAKLGAINDKNYQIEQMQWMLNTKQGPNADGKMTPEQKQAYLKDYRAKLITPEDDALWNRGASNAGYHYLGCAKTFALMGRAFADALLE